MYRTAGIGLFSTTAALSATADDLTQLWLEQPGDLQVTSGVTLRRSIAAELRWKR